MASVEFAAVSALSVVAAVAFAFWLGVTAAFAALVAERGCLPRKVTTLVLVPTSALAPAGVVALALSVVPVVAAAPRVGGELEFRAHPSAPFAGVWAWEEFVAGEGFVDGSLFAAVVVVVAADAGACCGCGGLGGGFAVAGAEAPASSRAANGIASSWSLSWLVADCCARDEANEIAVAKSDAIPGILGTGELPKAT